MDDLLATQGHSDIWVWSAAKFHDWIHDPGAAAVVNVDVHGYFFTT